MRTGLQKLSWLLPLFLALLAIAFVNPSGNFPLNDDWQYAYPVMTLVQQGDLVFQGIFAPNILLQVGWGYLFCKAFGGFDFTWLRVSTLVLAFAAVWIFARLCRRAGVEKQVAWLGAAALGFSPLFFLLGFTFMSDVPFLALCLGSLLCFFNYLHRVAELQFGGGTLRQTGVWRHGFWLFAACLFAIGSYFIRQPGIIFLPAFAIFIFWQNRRSVANWLLIFFLLLLTAATWFFMERWLKPSLGISQNYVPVGEKYFQAMLETPAAVLSEWIKKLVKTLVYLGFFALSLLPFLWEKMKRRRLFTAKNWLVILPLNALILFYLWRIGKVFPFGGNILFNFGLGTELLADVYTLGLPNTPRLPDWTMLAVNFISQLSISFLLIFLVKSWWTLLPENRRFAKFLILANCIYLPLLSITSFFDRYLLLPIASFFFVLLLFVDRQELRFPSLKWLLFLMMSTFSLLATKDYMNWNRARHEAFNYLISNGVDIREMDAGYEYNGFFNYHPDRLEKEGRSFWWVTDDEWMIAFGDVSGYRQVKSFPYRRWLFLKNDAVLVLQRE